MKKILFIVGLIVQLMLAPMTLAVTTSEYDFKNTFSDFQQGVTEQSKDLEEGVEGIVLPTYQDADVLSNGDGVTGILMALRTILDFLKLIMAPLAIIVTLIMGIRMVVAGKEQEETLTQSKNFLEYAGTGLIVIFVADALVNVIFGVDGEVLRAGEDGARFFGRNVASFVEGVYMLIQTIVGAIAVFTLVMAGMRYVAGSYSDEEVSKAKTQITWSLVGLVIIGLSELVVKDIIFRDKGQSLGFDAARELFASVTNFIVGTMGTLTFAFMLYAGYLYVTSIGNEDQVSKAKKIIGWAFAGLILTLAAFAISTTLVELDASR